jgi:hypothetical protein
VWKLRNLAVRLLGLICFIVELKIFLKSNYFDPIDKPCVKLGPEADILMVA